MVEARVIEARRKTYQDSAEYWYRAVQAAKAELVRVEKLWVTALDRREEAAQRGYLTPWEIGRGEQVEQIDTPQLDLFAPAVPVPASRRDD